jgi:hypothetical protein
MLASGIHVIHTGPTRQVPGSVFRPESQAVCLSSHTVQKLLLVTTARVYVFMPSSVSPAAIDASLHMAIFKPRDGWGLKSPTPLLSSVYF